MTLTFRNGPDSGTIRPVDKVAADVTPLGEVCRPVGKVQPLCRLRLCNCGRPRPVFCPQHKNTEMRVIRISTVPLTIVPHEETLAALSSCFRVAQEAVNTAPESWQLKGSGASLRAANLLTHTWVLLSLASVVPGNYRTAGNR